MQNNNNNEDHLQLEKPTQSLAHYLKETNLFPKLTPAILADLDKMLRSFSLAEGDILCHQGDPGDSMNVLIAGHLVATVENPDGTESIIAELKPPATVGETALLTGGNRTATVRAVKPAKLIQLSKENFHRLAEKHPSVIKKFIYVILPRVRQTQATIALAQVFGELKPAALQALESASEWIHLSNGTPLFKQGDVADAMYIVVNGRLQVRVEQEDGHQQIIGEVIPGEPVGELAMITNDHRTATVYAIRETNVIKITRAMFDKLLQQFPRSTMQITRTIVKRQQKTLRANFVRNTTALTFAIIPANPSVPMAEFIAQLQETLTQFGSVLHLNSDKLDEQYGRVDVSQIPLNGTANITLSSWLGEQETNYRYILYETDTVWSNWSHRCISQADRVLIVGNATDDPSPQPLEQAVYAHSTLAHKSLILIQPAHIQLPTDTGRWLEQRDIDNHHHLCLHNAKHWQRLARRLTGNTVALVLSGGGTRSFIHLGVFRALEEANIDVDMVGGTSMGAILGAAYAMDRSYDELYSLVQTISSPQKLIDYTLPIVSFFKAKKVTDLLKRESWGANIEDTWRTFFCNSCNVSKSKLDVHERGPLWQAIRASMALTPIFPPVTINGDVHIDGGYLNNFAIDLMQERYGNGLIIGVNSSIEQIRHYDFDPYLSGWQILWQRLNPFVKQVHIPHIFTLGSWTTSVSTDIHRHMMLNLADILIKPDITSIGLFDFDAYDQIIEVGYQTAQKAIQQWQENKQ